MADTFGALDVPVGVPVDQLAEPVGDPALGKLASFLAAVLNADLLTAWQGAQPTPEGDQATSVVRTVAFHNPYEYGFNDEELPTLFVYRDGGSTRQDAEERLVETSAIHALWLMPPLPREEQRARAPIFNAVPKAIAVALYRGVHTAWRDPDDDTPGTQPVTADIDSFALAQPTTTSASDLLMNGALGSGPLDTRLEVTITTTLAVGAYNTAAPFIVTARDGLGLTLARPFYLTSPNGPETIRTGIDLDTVSVRQPAAATTAGTVSVGNAALAGHYSSLLERAGFEWCRLASHKPVKLDGELLDGDRHVESRLPFHGVQMMIETREIVDLEPRGTAIFGSSPGAVVGAGATIHFTGSDGDVLTTSALPTDP